MAHIRFIVVNQDYGRESNNFNFASAFLTYRGINKLISPLADIERTEIPALPGAFVSQFLKVFVVAHRIMMH